MQAHPSAVTFPGGEALRDVQVRAVTAVREWNDRLGPDATWVACSHGDVIKAVVADALGLHLDLFQRLTADPCSVTAIRYTGCVRSSSALNDVGGSLADFRPARKRGKGRSTSDAAVGGGAGAT